MQLWRISNYADLTGTGGLRYSARWHTKGRPIIYAADHPAGALVEFLVHIDVADLPESFQLVTIDIDDDVAVVDVERHQLPKDWSTGTGNSRAVGDGWLKRGTSLLLRVPSAIIPDAFNMLINPSHPHATRMQIKKITKVPLDQRFARA